MEKLALNIKELMEALCISRTTAYELIKQEGFPTFRIGRKILIDRAGLERWLKEQQEKNEVV